MTTLLADEVARMLKVSRDFFLRTRTAMEARGFPKPLTLVSREITNLEFIAQRKNRRGRPPLRWSQRRVQAWIDGVPLDDDPLMGVPRTERAARRDRKLLEERLGT